MLFFFFLFGDDARISDDEADNAVVFEERCLKLIVKRLVKSGRVGMTAGGVFRGDVSPEVFI